MARPQRNKQLRPLHLFICEDSKSSKYYMQGLGRAKGINIKAEEADGTSPENVLKSAKEKQKLFKDEGTVQIYCLFDKDDCDDEKFKKAIQQCRKAGFVTNKNIADICNILSYFFNIFSISYAR